MDLSQLPKLYSANSYASVGFTLSILSFVLGPLGSIPALICSWRALTKFNELGVSEGKNLARVAFALSLLGLLLFCFFIFSSFAVLNGMTTTLREAITPLLPVSPTPY